ncbi:S-layer homology domain-containing protein [Pseudomonadota bacterium]
MHIETHCRRITVKANYFYYLIYLYPHTYMKSIKKYVASLVGGIVISTLVLANGAVILATPPPPEQPAPTECTECQFVQDDIDAAYALVDGLIADIDSYDIEGLLDTTVTDVYAGDPLMMVDMLTSKVMDGNLIAGPACEDSNSTFLYYSSFSYDGTTYCIPDEIIWNQPGSFFETMMIISEVPNPTLAGEWATVQIDSLELLTDFDGDDSDNVADLLDNIDSFFDILVDCEESNCPAEPECPDCEIIAAELSLAIDNLIAAEADADEIDAEITELEAEIDEVFDQLDELEQLREEFRQMVEDAGGMTDEDCDDFEVQSGQAWGIAHNFGDVQWCMTSESQIEQMLQNLDDYWETHSSSHLPSEQALNDQLDTLMDDYLALLDEYIAVLDEIEDLNQQIEDLIGDLEACLDELAALQALGFCMDQEIGPMEDILDDAAAALGWEPEAPPAEEPPADPPADDEGFPDIEDHWAEPNINNLAGAGVVAGDDLTGFFRPNDPINRAEASKIVSLAMGDDVDPTGGCVENPFPDVIDGDWFCPFVANSKDEGYFGGYDDGSFGPGNPILRAESAAVVLRALDFEVPSYASYSFPDVTGDEWYADYAEKAYLCGIFEGRALDGEQVFAGGADITRAEFAKVVDVTLLGAGLHENDCNAGDIEPPECPDCEAIYAEVEAIDAQLSALDEEFNTLMDQILAIEDLQAAFEQMVEDAGGMTGADCDGFEVGSGQAWGIANAFGGVEFCLSSQSQIQDLTTAMGEYWDNNSSQHLPSEQSVRDAIDANFRAYEDLMGQFEAKMAEYEECLDELAALQADGLCT